jgi:hypothetical protein
MLVAWPPTVARFLTACPKPEAFTTIQTATLAQVLGARASRSVQRALSDRDGIGVSDRVVQMDDGFESIVFALAARDLMGERGYDRNAGADEEIVRLSDQAQRELDEMAPGAGGKRVTPNYVLDAAVARQDSVRVRSHRRADAWARSSTDPRRLE